MQTIQLGCITYTKPQAIAIMQHSTSGDMTYPLASQLIAAKLNITCRGSNSSCISSAITAAGNFLCAHPVGSNVSASSSAWQQFKATYNRITSYNQGQLCAPPAGTGNGAQQAPPPASLSMHESKATYNTITSYNQEKLGAPPAGNINGAKLTLPPASLSMHDGQASH